MSRDNRYNGWRNYETWLAALHLDSDWLQEEAAQFEDASAFGEYIKDYLYELMEEYDMPKAGLFSDILDAGMRTIDFLEIAEHYEEFFKKEEEEEETQQAE